MPTILCTDDDRKNSTDTKRNSIQYKQVNQKIYIYKNYPLHDAKKPP